MPELTADTVSKAYTIAGETHNIPQPYAEGHVLTTGEASQLNQVYAENIRNNLAAKLTELKDAGTYDAGEFQDYINEYCADYEMGVRTGGGGRTSDPVQARAVDIAKDLVRDALKKAGVKVSDITAKQLTEKAREVVAANPKIVDLARKQIEDSKAVAGLILGDMPTEAEVEAPAKGRKAKAEAEG